MIINSTFFVIPSMMLRSGQAWWHILLLDGPLFMLASLSFVHFYLSAQRAIYHTIKGKKRFIPALMAIGIGLGVNNSRAVLEALFGYKTAFIRTPKPVRPFKSSRPGCATACQKMAGVFLNCSLVLCIPVALSGRLSWGIGGRFPFCCSFRTDSILSVGRPSARNGEIGNKMSCR